MMLFGILPFLVHWIALSQYGGYNNHDLISQTPKSHWTLLNELAELPEEDIESFLPQICNVVLDRESLNNDELFDYFENIIVNKCIECFPFGFRVCGLLKASVPSPSDGLFRSGLLSTTSSQIAQRREARFIRFQNMIEYVTCFGSKSAPLNNNPHTQTRHDPATFSEEYKDARREALRSQYFQDYGFMLDSLGRLGLELRKYPVPQRNYHLRSALSQYNSILFSRMLAKMNRARGTGNDHNHDDHHQQQQQQSQSQSHHPKHPFSGLHDGITAADIARHCPDIARHSLHYPLLHSKDRVLRILRFVPSECEALPSRDRCPYVVTVELLEESTLCNEEGLYAPETGHSRGGSFGGYARGSFAQQQVGNSANSAINLDIFAEESLGSAENNDSDNEEMDSMKGGDCMQVQEEREGNAIIGAQSNVIQAASILRGGNSGTPWTDPVVTAATTKIPQANPNPLLSARFRRPHNRIIPPAIGTGDTHLTAELVSTPLQDSHVIGLGLNMEPLTDTSAAVLVGSELTPIELSKPALNSDRAEHIGLQPVSHLNQPPVHHNRPALVAAKTLDDRRAVIRANSPFGHLPGWRVASFVVKSGDDIQKEALAMQLIEYIQGVFLREGIDIYLKPYQILPTGYQAGLIEFLEGTQSIDRIKKSYSVGGSGGGVDYDDGGHDSSVGSGGDSAVSLSLREHFERTFGPGYGFVHARAVQNFVRSLVGYSLVTYLLQVKDRHNANILIDSDGHIIHIDYGFILGDSPGFNLNFESAPFKLTRDYVDVMGGVDSAAFRLFEDLFLKGFTALRGHADGLSAIIQLFYGDKRRGAAEAMAARLLSPSSNQDVLGLIRDSLDNWRTRNYDWFQQQSNNIRM